MALDEQIWDDDLSRKLLKNSILRQARAYYLMWMLGKKNKSKIRFLKILK